MARKFIRVNLPVNQPDKTVKLCLHIGETHTDLGSASPLTGLFDMTLFGSQLTSCVNFRKTGKKKAGQSQSKMNQCAKACGIAKGQNLESGDTLYVHTVSIKKYLALKFRAAPEQLSEYGFDVVITQTGGRRNVRVDIPNDTPEHFLLLCNDIKDKHEDDGSTSILNDSTVDMTEYLDELDTANDLLTQAQDLSDESQSANDQAINIMGYGEGQTTLTPDTLYNFYTGIRDRLLDVYKGAEEQLSEWGYDVVLSSKETGGKKGGDNPQPLPG